MKICLVTVNFNNWKESIRFIKSIEGYDLIDNIVVVDNMSTDDSFFRLHQMACHKIDVVESGRNGGYGFGNNFGIKYAIQKYMPDLVIISNPDVIFQENLVEKMRNIFERCKDVAVVAPQMIHSATEKAKNLEWKIPKKKWKFFLYDLPVVNKLFQNIFNCNDKEIYVDAVEGSFLMIRVEDFVKAGGYDENMFLYYEETVLGLKLRKLGKKTCIMADETFIHHHATTIKKNFNSGLKRTKLLWESKRYVFKTYYHATIFDLLFFDILRIPFMIIASLRGFS